ncbi:RNA polymerase sigma-70 factor, ECF subfamily protein [Actinomadura sp. NBRC 104412]|uniref:RNA polymerase sigma factor n=1 Tax=Actinomadura sp. NBRC 104412 TaxID=3032203 RepID=UPI0024A1065F|nr:sigma-70 family RNA polymerase sigma factor [Actinomadura sp. NBRC 104412]GLZ07830.1 RNA polymerase sigma-70 factor, ECF subfamily protein [Actinomadura sp. NBRC 104412]
MTPPHDRLREQVDAELARVVREHAGRLTACLVRVLGDFAAAEDLVQDAIETALRRWPIDGIPEHPDAWLLTTARRRGIDLLRRQATYRDKLAQLTGPVPAEPDDWLRLIFTCCHPALPRTAQIALTLRTVCGLTTAQIAAAFLVPEATVSQRITRAKRKITDAGIPYRIPADADLPDRLGQVLTVIYLLFNEGYLTSTGDRSHAPDLAGDAEWLAAQLAWLMPKQPEALGLLALIRLHQARTTARFDPAGNLVPLPDQDRARWDHAAIAEATRLLERAAAHRRPGPYQLQAAIVACHAEAPTWADTDWPQIVVLYDMLLALAPSPVYRLHRAIALRHHPGERGGPRNALADLDDLPPADRKVLERYPLFHATRAELLRALDQPDTARAADERALALTTNPAQQNLLHQRLAWN